MPSLSAVERPFDVRAVELQRECQWWEYPPSEGRRGRHGIAVAEGARRQHAAGRTVCALRRRAVGDHPEERDDPLAGCAIRPFGLQATGRRRPVNRSMSNSSPLDEAHRCAADLDLALVGSLDEAHRCTTDLDLALVGSLAEAHRRAADLDLAV